MLRILIALGKITLKIKRTAASKRSCNHPSCWQTRQLKTIPTELRYKIAVEEKIFVPSQGLACPIHINGDTWEQANQLIESEHSEFTDAYIADMFKLLSNPPSKYTTKESRMYFTAGIIIFFTDKTYLIIQTAMTRK